MHMYVLCIIQQGEWKEVLIWYRNVYSTCTGEGFMSISVSCWKVELNYKIRTSLNTYCFLHILRAVLQLLLKTQVCEAPEGV